MPRGGQGDKLLFKEGGVTKRSMPPSFHANLFALIPMYQLFGHGVLGLAVKDELVYYGL